MARGVDVLLGDHLGVKDPIALVGHDIGMVVAYAFISADPNSVDRLVPMEAPLPGPAACDALVATPRLRDAAMWHSFSRDAENALAELLTFGRERQHIQHFFARLAYDQGAIGQAELDVYACAFAAAGAMRAGFELYRAFDRDGGDDRAALAETGKLEMPAPGLGGTASFFPPMAAEMLGEVAADVQISEIPRCGPWIAEQNPAALLDELFRFLG